MDVVLIPEEYAVRRWTEKSIRKSAAGLVGGSGSMKQGNAEPRSGELWTALVRRLLERKDEIPSGSGEKGSHDLLSGCFSA
ncbi:hypothetical protein KSP39_PZI000010 [Platanthera zijinensis]|uniref:Uncharacterized protein n=1 Tax=Platanthera zijinensis TaxID=2320716 RepID=A0AAP0C0E0_9ASPA